MRWSGPWTIVGRTLVANRLLAGSACGKRHRGRPLNATVRQPIEISPSSNVGAGGTGIVLLRVREWGGHLPRPAEGRRGSFGNSLECISHHPIGGMLGVAILGCGHRRTFPNWR